MTTILGVLAALFGLTWVGAALQRRHRQRALPFAERSDVDLRHIHQDHYPDIDFEAFRALWSDIAAVFEVAPERLRPPDRFGVELTASPGLTNDEDMELGRVIRTHAKRAGVTEDCENCSSVHDVITALLQQSRKK